MSSARTRVAVGVKAVAVLALVAMTTGGCGLVPTGTPEPRSGPPKDFAKPEAEAPDEFSPVEQQPRDTREYTFSGHRLWAPTALRQSERTLPDGATKALVLNKPAADGIGVCEIVAFVEKNPPSTVEEQTYGLVGLKELAGASEVTRESVDWPDAPKGVLVRWTERTAVRQGELTQRFAQLSVQPSPAEIVSVIAVGPVDEFDDCGVADVLRTLKLDA